MYEIFNNCTGFQWDKGNSEKNLEKYRVVVHLRKIINTKNQETEIIKN